jgi:exosortase/archaeosortase
MGTVSHVHMQLGSVCHLLPPALPTIPFGKATGAYAAMVLFVGLIVAFIHRKRAKYNAMYVSLNLLIVIWWGLIAYDFISMANRRLLWPGPSKTK